MADLYFEVQNMFTKLFFLHIEAMLSNYMRLNTWLRMFMNRTLLFLQCIPDANLLYQMIEFHFFIIIVFISPFSWKALQKSRNFSIPPSLQQEKGKRILLRQYLFSCIWKVLRIMFTFYLIIRWLVKLIGIPCVSSFNFFMHGKLN